MRGLLSVFALIGTYPETNTRATGNAQGQGHHVQNGGQTGCNLMAGRGHNPLPRNEQGHQGEGGHLNHQ